MANFYTADLHLSYKDILKLCNRPFSSIEEMNDTLIKNINERCGKDDLLYIIGDVAMYKVNPVKMLKEIKAKKVLIRGNHDAALLHHRSFRNCFEDVRSNMLVTDGSYDLYLSHYPMAEWDGYWKGRYLFYGHVHNAERGGAALMQFLPTAINVGVDVQDFYPKTAKELIEDRIRHFRAPDVTTSTLLDIVTFENGDNRGKKRLDTSLFA